MPLTHDFVERQFVKLKEYTRSYQQNYNLSDYYNKQLLALDMCTLLEEVYYLQSKNDSNDLDILKNKRDIYVYKALALSNIIKSMIENSYTLDRKFLLYAINSIENIYNSLYDFNKAHTTEENLELIFKLATLLEQKTSYYKLNNQIDLALKTINDILECYKSIPKEKYLPDTPAKFALALRWDIYFCQKILPKDITESNYSTVIHRLTQNINKINQAEELSSDRLLTRSWKSNIYSLIGRAKFKRYEMIINSCHNSDKTESAELYKESKESFQTALEYSANNPLAAYYLNLKPRENSLELQNENKWQITLTTPKKRVYSLLVNKEEVKWTERKKTSQERINYVSQR